MESRGPSPRIAPGDSDVRMGTDEGFFSHQRTPPRQQILQTPVRVSRSSGATRGNSTSTRRSPLPPTAPVTPNRMRTQDERNMGYANSVVAGMELRRQRGEYAFQELPQAGHGTASSPLQHEGSPARMSQVAVSEAVMSFADFLYFLEEKQSEYALMPTIIARFSELGAVIESQKRHIDLWKGKELDLAISEAEQNLELIADLASRLEKTELKLATTLVEKQSWEEKYQKSVLEIKSTTHRAQDQAAHLQAKINELQFQNQDLENVVKDRNDTIVSMEKDLEARQRAMGQMDKHGATLTQEHRDLVEQCARQEQVLRGLQSQVQQLQQQCETERKRADEYGNAAHGYEIQHKEEKRLREHLDGELQILRRERDESSRSVNKLVGESGKHHAELEAFSVQHEQQMQTLRDKLQTKDTELTELRQKLQSENDRVRQMNKEVKIIRKQADDGMVAVKTDLEAAFTARVAKLRADLGEENRRARAENEELQQRCQHLQQLSQKKSNQIAELMTSQQNWMGEGNQRLTDLTSAVAEWQAKCEQLQQEIRDREKASADALRKHGADIQEQYNTHVQDMETYLERKTEESDQLRAALKAREDELVKLREEAHAEVSKWQTEYQELSTRHTSLDFEYGSLHRELEHRKKELELRGHELQTLKQQIEAYLAPDNERSKQTELLHRDRLRLEEQNRHLTKQLEELKKEAEAKFEEMNSAHLRTAEQESAQRATVVSLHHEKDDLQRALGEISAEKVALEGHLQGMEEEKEVLMESLTQFEKQNAELDDKGRQLLEALSEVEKEKSQVIQALETAQSEKAAVESRLAQLQRDFADEIKRLQTSSSADQQLQTEVETLSAKLGRREAEIRELQQEAEQYYIASCAAENTTSQAKHTLDDREAELDRAKRELEHSREKTNEAESKIEQLVSELTQLRDWNERYKKDIETLKSQAEERERQLRSDVETRESEVMRQGETQTQQQQQLVSEMNQLREWNEKYKKEIEALTAQAQSREYQRRSEAEARESELMRQGRGLEAEYEKVKSDFTSLQISAEQEVRRLQTALERQKAEFQLEHQRLVATNERLERQARALSEEVASLKETLARVREECAQATNDLEFQRSLLQQREEHMQQAMREKGQVEEALEQQLERVERAFDDFKRQTMRNVKDKKDAIDRLEAENRDVRSKLAQQTERKEQAMQLAQGDKTAMTADLLRKEQNLSEARARLRHLEEQVKSLNRERQSRQDGTQGAVEQEQRKRIDVELERDELRNQLKKIQEEKETLREQLSTATDELASLKRQLNETDVVRSTLKHTKTEMSTRLNSLELELHQTQNSLVTERDRIKKLKDALNQARHESQAEIADKSRELETVSSKLQKQTADLERKERLHADRVDDLQSNEANLIKRLKLVQQRYDASASREAELQQELDELANRTVEEREQLLEELKQTQIVNEVLQGDWSLHDGVRELKNRLIDEQKLVGQHASTIERKETRIRELEAKLRKLELRLRECDAQRPIAEDVQHEMDAMSAKLSKLTIENQRLKDEEHREKVSLLEGSRVMKSELLAKCEKLQNKIGRLEEENEQLRMEQQVQDETYAASMATFKHKTTDHRKCQREIEQLLAELEEKEASLQTQQPHPTRQKTRQKSTTASSSRRVRELERELDDKEKKIMMLNDHLTYLMTSSIELQHENETMQALQQQQQRRQRPGIHSAP